MDIINHSYSNAGGCGMFVSKIKCKEREDALIDAEQKRKNYEQKNKLNAVLVEKISERKAMYSGDTKTTNSKYYILGGVAVVMIFTVIMVS